MKEKKFLRWVFLAGGLWIAASPWILGFASANLGRWSNVMVGGLVALAALYLSASEKES
ncbi:MAG: SPW repeat protein [Candidatus Brennerbacteria bacterium]|nr:SPW repeat protein [Candidatus Brennerbacteria bacterium]